MATNKSPSRPAAYDYEQDTKAFYQSPDVAAEYHEAFTSRRGLKALRFKLVAHRERSIVRSFLQRCPHARVLDIPAGTGKLAPVISPLASSVVSADISAEMLAFAREEYRRLGYANVSFVVCSAEEIASTTGERFDVAICLRLMQRVPRETKAAILGELAAVADYAIISFGHDSGWHRIRRMLRRRLLGGEDVGVSTLERIADIEALLDQSFERLATAAVIPVLSQERVWLLRSKRARASS